MKQYRDSKRQNAYLKALEYFKNNKLDLKKLDELEVKTYGNECYYKRPGEYHGGGLKEDMSSMPVTVLRYDHKSRMFFTENDWDEWIAS